ncbi:hypothetical protein SM40611_17260 [Xanthomonas hortorum pv. gardneri]|nr:hypothetical protein SM40611_17260 [Xanthomonas hortorum pv. gardneri]
MIRDGAPRIADPDFANWFEAAGIQTVPVLLDGRPKLLDARLAEPAVLVLEPGLECVPHAAHAPSIAMAANGAVS